jgi:hypothetical protein
MILALGCVDVHLNLQNDHRFISSVKYAFQIKYPILFYGSSITRYDDYLAKNCIKIG